MKAFIFTVTLVLIAEQCVAESSLFLSDPYVMKEKHVHTSPHIIDVVKLHAQCSQFKDSDISYENTMFYEMLNGTNTTIIYKNVCTLHSANDVHTHDRPPSTSWLGFIFKLVSIIILCVYVFFYEISLPMCLIIGCLIK